MPLRIAPSESIRRAERPRAQRTTGYCPSVTSTGLIVKSRPHVEIAIPRSLWRNTPKTSSYSANRNQASAVPAVSRSSLLSRRASTSRGGSSSAPPGFRLSGSIRNAIARKHSSVTNGIRKMSRSEATVRTSAPIGGPSANDAFATRRSIPKASIRNDGSITSTT